MDQATHWAVAAAPVGGAEAAGLLRRYYTHIVGRYHGREATAEEVDAVLAEEPSDDLAPPGGIFLVARYGGEAAGCVGVRLLTPEIAELTRLYIDPAARGTGGGAVLLAAAEQAARGLGRRTMRLDTRRDLVEARALYARHGYTEIPSYNASPYADHWFEKPLR
ncbi:GNAT family N-acetyltransferase [Peterkaempfera bronchialis]|uniref:GNAT family N-acetyltransferase n=1 Tax=Peterkaempfera bronchialis TaxID=2126346 RepID=A0A345T5P1_9ACTN|nr:GNAT family N-acetyltransferase [Peterkaempfera bronchialis]